MLLFPFFVQLMSSTFVRDGISNPELFNGFVLPKVFTKMVYMLSYLRRDNLSTFEYNIDGIASLAELKTYCRTLIESESFIEELKDFLHANSDYLETFNHFQGVKDVELSMVSTLTKLSNVNSVNDLCNIIFTFMEKLGRDLCNDATSFETMPEFFFIYLSSEDKVRTLGCRLMTWISHDKGILSTSGDELYFNASFMFRIFVSTTEIFMDDLCLGTPTPGKSDTFGQINMSLKSGVVLSLLLNFDKAIGNPSNVTSDDLPKTPSNKKKPKAQRGNGSPSPYRDFSTLRQFKKTGPEENLDYKIIHVVYKCKVVPIVVPSIFKLTRKAIDSLDFSLVS